MARFEFEKLEQRIGSHSVPVPLDAREIAETLQTLMSLQLTIESEEQAWNALQRQRSERKKELHEALKEVTAAYRERKRPKEVDGLWGFDFDAKDNPVCETCGVAAEEHTPENTECRKRPKQEFPLGQKWFVRPETGEYWGPFAVTSADMQEKLPAPEFKRIDPFHLTIDTEQSGEKVLSEAEVSEAQQKLDEEERAAQGSIFDTARELVDENADAFSDDDKCEHCHQPLDWHDPAAKDPCGSALVKAADELQAAQERRTQEKYGSDRVLEPEVIYNCEREECGAPTFGRDLQPVNIDGEKKFVCFTCESALALEAQRPAEKTKPDEENPFLGDDKGAGKSKKRAPRKPRKK